MSTLTKFKELLKEWNSPGVPVPLANDGVDGPSVTLLFSYVSFIATMCSLIYLHIYPEKLHPTIMATAIWSIALLIYRIRRVDNLKFDLDDRSFEINAEKETTIKRESTKEEINVKPS